VDAAIGMQRALAPCATVYRVPSMGTPADDADAGAIRASEAVRLLEDRAAAQGVPLAWDGPAAEVAGRICRRLDGIPLAVELAAARLRVMPAAELDARLDERFLLLTGGSRAALPRQQTLRAMVDWSWELLTGAERAVLARLSVFAGGFGLAAAEAVAAGPDVPGAEVLGHLGALVDKSHVQFGDTPAGQGRYRLLETVRQYAAGHLKALGPAAGAAHRDLLPCSGRGGRPAADGRRSGRLAGPARCRRGGDCHDGRLACRSCQGKGRPRICRRSRKSEIV
jgi:predicted ATPase